MNLVLDLGNTQHKCAVFDDVNMVFHSAKERFTPTDLIQLFQQFPIQYSILSSVEEQYAPLEKVLAENTKYILFNHHLPLPIKNHYTTPETLGKDRLASAVGAWAEFSGQHVLVIDAGTCIKYDFVDAWGEYLGGAISPGLLMRFKAMHNYTARLPLIAPEIINREGDISLTGDSTQNSLLAGGAKGAVLEAEGFIREYDERYPNLQVVLTGGDAPFFELHLKRKIFALPELVLYGLNIILRHNLKQD